QREGIARALGRGEGETERSPWRELHAAHHACRKRGDRADLTACDIEQVKAAASVLVDRISDRSTVLADVELLDVPARRRGHRGEAPRTRIEPAETCDIAILVRSRTQGAVRRECQVTVGDVFLKVANRGQLAGGQIEQVRV